MVLVKSFREFVSESYAAPVQLEAFAGSKPAGSLSREQLSFTVPMLYVLPEQDKRLKRVDKAQNTPNLLEAMEENQDKARQSCKAWHRQ